MGVLGSEHKRLIRYMAVQGQIDEILQTYTVEELADCLANYCAVQSDETKDLRWEALMGIFSNAEHIARGFRIEKLFVSGEPGWLIRAFCKTFGHSNFDWVTYTHINLRERVCTECGYCERERMRL